MSTIMTEVAEVRPTLQLVLGKDQSGGWKLSKCEVLEELKLQIADVAHRGSQLPTIVDDETLCEVIDWIGEAKGITGRIEGARVAVKRPFLNAEKLIDGTTKEVVADLSEVLKNRESELSAWNGAKRREQEEIERQQRELARQATIAAMREPDPERKEHLEVVASNAMTESLTAVKSTPGVSTRLGYDKLLDDWKLVASTNPQLLRVELNLAAVDDLVRAMKERGEKIEPNSIPGITLIPKATSSVKRQW